MKKVAIVIVGFFVLLSFSACSTKKKQNNIVIPDEQVITYDDGDTVYCSEKESIKYDEKSGAIFYDNVLIAYLFEEIDDASAQSLADSVNGIVAGHLSGSVNMLQIVVEHTDVDTLNKYAGILMKNENVLYASYDAPISFDSVSSDTNPWSIDGKTNNWYVDAIDAYSAWEIYDSRSVGEIKVGILDSGFDLQHEDISNATMLKGFEANTPNDHGTAVMGLIGATNNEKGGRGIADKATLVCADRVELLKNDENFWNYGIYTKVYKTMIDNGCKVINNSFANILFTPEGLSKQIYKLDNPIQSDIYYSVFKDKMKNEIMDDETYDMFIADIEASAKLSSVQCMNFIISEMLHGNDCILVQGAGNGYNDCSTGYDAYYSGYFCSVNKETFNLLSEPVRIKLKEKGITYETVKEHIIVVGAVDNIVDDEGRYQLKSSDGGKTWGSCFGETVDICAPGNDVFTMISTTEDNKKNPYKFQGGTSLAAPIVSGSVAMLWQIDPSLSSAEIKALLEETAGTAIGVEDDKGSEYPMLNLGSAARKLTGKTNSNSVNYTVDDALVYVQSSDYTHFAMDKGYTCYHIPKISIDGVDTSAANKHIFDDLYSRLQKRIEQAGFVPEIGMHYKHYCSGSLITIFVEIVDGGMGFHTYRIYTIDSGTGNILSKEDIIKHFGITEEEFDSGVYDAYVEEIKELTEFYGESFPSSDVFKRDTLADENISRAYPYINEDGDLCFIGFVEWEGHDGDGLYNFYTKTHYKALDLSITLVCDVDHSNEIVSPSTFLNDTQNTSSGSYSGDLQELWNQFLQDSHEDSLYFLLEDYDGDGNKEAFGITGSGSYSDDVFMCNDVKIYFVDSSGYISCMKDKTSSGDDLYGFLLTQAANPTNTIEDYYASSGNSKFVVWEFSALGSASWSYVFGVKNGKAYEPDISGQYMLFQQKESGEYLGSVSDWSNGYHDFIEYTFIFDETTGQFVSK